MLEVQNLNVSYNDVHILKNINLNISRNEIVVVIGQNGAGKSTLLSSIVGLLKVKSGRIIYNNIDIANKKVMNIIKKGITLVPESSEVFPNMTVIDNLLIGGYSLESKHRKSELIDEVFKFFPILRERQSQNADTLSGGERQMLAIGRALMADPDLMLLDEPSLGLQPLFVKKIFEIIKDLKKIGKTVLLVEQNINKSLEISDRGYVIENGKIVMTGFSADLKNNEYLKQAYLGI